MKADGRWIDLSNAWLRWRIDPMTGEQPNLHPGVSAVIAACDRCSWRSGPIDPVQAERTVRRHQERHDREDRERRAAATGHRVDGTYTVYVEDDMSGYVRCTCGWQSRTVKACGWADLADAHFQEVGIK